MVVHIVMWKLKEQAEGAGREENAQKIKTMLESLKGRIPGLLRLEVGIDFSRTDASADVVLYSEFEDREALARYQAHPEHVKVADFITLVRSERRVADYER